MTSIAGPLAPIPVPASSHEDYCDAQRFGATEVLRGMTVSP